MSSPKEYILANGRAAKLELSQHAFLKVLYI
jgi:hypothetical protein